MTTTQRIYSTDLRPRAHQLGEDQAFREAVWKHIAGHKQNLAPAGLDLGVHRDDQMLLHSLNLLRGAAPALSQYFSVALQQHRVADQILAAFLPDRSQVKVLDFACGFGRMLRLMVHSVPPSQIWASDIQQEAVDFVSSRFGVNGIVSDADPAQFNPGQKFDFIWVASLFSHLPAHLFEAWLAKLASLLTGRGVLCFSVHDESLLSPGRRMPDEGILFAGHSENGGLKRSEYGTSHVSEAYVKAAVGRAFGAPHPCFRVKRGLAYQQDLYVVARNPGQDMSVLQSFRPGPWGWVDFRGVGANGDWQVSGWAVSLDEGGLDSVAVTCDGKRIHCATSVERKDVEAVYEDPRFRMTGWECSLPRDRSAPAPFLEVSAVGKNRERALLYAGPLVEPKLKWRWWGLELVLHRLAYLAFKLRGRL